MRYVTPYRPDLVMAEPAMDPTAFESALVAGVVREQFKGASP